MKKLKVPVRADLGVRSLTVKGKHTPSDAYALMQELRSKLEELGLDSTGLKLALVERLEAALSKAATGVPPATTASAGNVLPAPELDPAPTAAQVLELGMAMQLALTALT